MTDASRKFRVVDGGTMATPERIYVQTTYGGGNGGSMEPSVPIKDYIDARDDAVESRLMAKLDELPKKGTVWGAVATGVGLLAAMLAFGGDRFDGGVSISPTLERFQAEQAARDSAQDAQLRSIDDKLDVLIERTGGNDNAEAGPQGG